MLEYPNKVDVIAEAQCHCPEMTDCLLISPHAAGAVDAQDGWDDVERHHLLGKDRRHRCRQAAVEEEEVAAEVGARLYIDALCALRAITFKALQRMHFTRLPSVTSCAPLNIRYGKSRCPTTLNASQEALL